MSSLITFFSLHCTQTGHYLFLSLPSNYRTCAVHTGKNTELRNELMFSRPGAWIHYMTLFSFDQGYIQFVEQI